MLYQSLLATALLVGSSSAAGIAQRQAETPFTTVVTMTLGPDESNRPLICPCPTSYSANPITGGQYTLPVTSASLATAKKRQDPTTTTITENLPGSSVIIVTATCTCPVPSGGGSTTPTTAPTTVSGATPSTPTAAPSTSTRSTIASSFGTSSASTGAQGNGASSKENFKGGRTFGALVAAMVAGAAFLTMVA